MARNCEGVRLNVQLTVKEGRCALTWRRGWVRVWSGGVGAWV